MAELIASRSVTLSAANPRLQSPAVNLGTLTAAITIRLRLPTTAQPLSWAASGRVRVTLVFVVDGVEYRCVGSVSGGIHTDSLGVEIPEYSLTFSPPVLFGDKAREYLKTAQVDAEGNYLDVPLTRIGETGTTVQGYLILERISGTINTVVAVASTTESAAPVLEKYHNSVAFDAASSAQESSGDGVLSVSHTSSGTDRAAFIAVAHLNTVAPYAGSVTYGGNATTEHWDAQYASLYANAGYSYVAPPTSSTTVTSTLTGSTNMYWHGIGVVSFTGVDQTTPTGTPQTYQAGADVEASVTVASVGNDDMVVDSLMSRADTPVIGADQTQRVSIDNNWPTRFRVSTQPGSSGGVMSWTFTGGQDYQPVHLGAIAFKAAAGGGGGFVSNLMLTGVGK